MEFSVDVYVLLSKFFFQWQMRTFWKNVFMLKKGYYSWGIINIWWILCLISKLSLPIQDLKSFNKIKKSFPSEKKKKKTLLSIFTKFERIIFCLTPPIEDYCCKSQLMCCPGKKKKKISWYVLRQLVISHKEKKSALLQCNKFPIGTDVIFRSFVLGHKFAVKIKLYEYLVSWC